jgi:PhnB protein
MSFDPYLFFSGTCKEAFTKYQQIFGGEVFVMTNAEAPDGGMPGGAPDLVIHAALTLENGRMLMASDDPSGDGSGTKGVSISYTAKDEGDAKRVFDALSEGGEVTGALQETFFSPSFGTCTDRWGVAWMVLTQPPAQT